MDAPFAAEQRAHESRGALTDTARIDDWVTEQLHKPWPLSCTQLDLIRRAFASQRGAA